MKETSRNIIFYIFIFDESESCPGLFIEAHAWRSCASISHVNCVVSGWRITASRRGCRQWCFDLFLYIHFFYFILSTSASLSPSAILYIFFILYMAKKKLLFFVFFFSFLIFFSFKFYLFFFFIKKTYARYRHIYLKDIYIFIGTVTTYLCFIFFFFSYLSW